MDTLLKVTRTMFVFSCSVFAISAIFLFSSQNLFVSRTKLSSCIIPSIVTTSIKIQLAGESKIINCRDQKVTVYPQGKLEFISASAKSQARIFVKELHAANSDSIVVSSVDPDLQAAQVDIVYTGSVRMGSRTLGKSEVLSYTTNNNVLGVSSEKEAASMEAKTPIISVSSYDHFVEMAHKTDSQTSESVALSMVKDLVNCSLSSEKGCADTSELLVVANKIEEKAVEVELAETKQSPLVVVANAVQEGPAVLGAKNVSIAEGTIVANSKQIHLSTEASLPVYAEKDISVYAEFEVKKKDDPFNGLDLKKTETFVLSKGEKITIGTDITDLENNTGYKWRVRIVNSETGETTSWKDFGSNTEYEADFFVTETTRLEIALNKNIANTNEKFSVTVTAKKQNGEIDTSYNGIVKFISDSKTADLPLLYAFEKTDKGQKTFTDYVKFYESGDFFITVTDIYYQNLSDTKRLSITPGEVSFLTFTADKYKIIPGESVKLMWSASEEMYLNFNGALIKEQYGTFILTPESSKFYTIKGTTKSGKTMEATVFIEVNQAAANQYLPSEVKGANTTIFSTGMTLFESVTKQDSIRDSQIVGIQSKNIPSCPMINSFTAQRSLNKGEIANLQWDVSNADIVVLDTIPGYFAPKGSASFVFEKSQLVTLKAIKNNCVRHVTLTVKLNPDLPTGFLMLGIIGVIGIEGVGFYFATRSHFADRFNLFAGIVMVLNRIKKYTPWGIIYDYKSKKPLAGVVVNLYRKNGKKVIASVISDAQGYILLPVLAKGIYNLKLKKAGYAQYEELNEEFDKGFTYLSTGKNLTMEFSNHRMYSIPMQKLEESVTLLEDLKTFMAELSAILSVFLPVMAVVFAAYLYVLTSNLFVLAILAGYSLIIAYKFAIYLLLKPKYGVVKLLDGKPVANVTVGLFSSKDDTLIGKTVTDFKGRYVFYAPNSDYYIRILGPQYRLIGKNISKNGASTRYDTFSDSIRIISRDLTAYMQM
jgi:5-hydroxyisourate hydrolase-like protein (transthyretin family)